MNVIQNIHLSSRTRRLGTNTRIMKEVHAAHHHHRRHARGRRRRRRRHHHHHHHHYVIIIGKLQGA